MASLLDAIACGSGWARLLVGCPVDFVAGLAVIAGTFETGFVMLFFAGVCAVCFVDAGLFDGAVLAAVFFTGAFLPAPLAVNDFAADLAVDFTGAAFLDTFADEG